MSEATNYIPGMCNINQAEIMKRRRIGYLGLAASSLLLAVFIAFDAEWWMRLVIFIPAFTSATGFLQARNKFCVGFAGANMQHADDDGEAIEITDKKSLQLDKQKAQKINLQAFGIALIATVVTVILPSL